MEQPFGKQKVFVHTSPNIVSFWRAHFLEMEIILSKFLFLNTQKAKGKDVKYSFPGKASSSSFFFPNTSKTVPIDAQETQKKLFLRLMNLIIVLLLETISWSGKTSKRFVDLCAHFKPTHSKNHFVAKKDFFSLSLLRWF